MEHFQAVFNHLALPHCLPQREDAKLDEIEKYLLNHLITSARLMRDVARNGHELDPDFVLKTSNAWSSIMRCLAAAKTLHINQHVNRTRLLSELASFNTDTDVLVVHIHSQNAAVLIHRLGSPDKVIFEVFETSPKNEDVLAADNALQWDFPGSSVAIPLDTFNCQDFRLSLATFLEQASLESTKAFAAHTFKAGQEVYEYRDTPDPTLITSMLVAILEENGKRITLPLLRKRVRDDICWSKAEKPWRRLPHWLVLRVTIARYLSLLLGNEIGRFEYKLFLAISLTTFLEFVGPSLAVDQVEFLKTKICRRMAKLDLDRSQKSLPYMYFLLNIGNALDKISPHIKRVVGLASGRVKFEWDEFKKATTKSIPPLPKKATYTDTTLTLRVSGKALEDIRIMSRNRVIGRQTAQAQWRPTPNLKMSSITNEHFSKYARPYFDLAKIEDLLHEDLDYGDIQDAANTPVARISRLLNRYANKALPVYAGNSEQMSLLILNTMELWMKLDTSVCAAYPLLWDYHPVLTPEILDVLRLANFSDMVRLRDVQAYLRKRIDATNGSKFNLFQDPSSDSFAVRYYDEGPEAEKLQVLHQVIEDYAEGLKQSKFQEWQKKSQDFERLTKVVDESTCIYFKDEDNPWGEEVHYESQCPRCQSARRLARMRIQIYEHPLPSDAVMAKTVIFELMCPRDIALYRDMTWMLISRLGNPNQAMGVEPKCLLRDYAELDRFVQSQNSAFTLASVTKSFLKTHYAIVGFPVEWEGGRDGVCRPNGLKLAYFDLPSNIWTGRSLIRPTFAHHVQLQLPEKSPFRALLTQKNFAVDSGGPSSYEIMASQMSCPSGINSHEFIAFQTLLSGSARRWLTILVELASTNLNLSSETTMVLLEHLALQCGPESDRQDTLGLVHSVFRDVNFVLKLLEQVELRLTGLAANWREVHLMSAMTTLALRIYDLAVAAGLPPLVIERARKSIAVARETCVGWVRLLRREIQASQDESTTQRLQQHTLVAALICQKTFVIHLGSMVCLDAASLGVYVESTTALQENIPSNLEALPQSSLHDLVHVVKLSERLFPLLSRFILDNQDGLRDGLMNFWPDAERVGTSESTVSINAEGWVCIDVAETMLESHQVVHWDLRLGSLLVNGKPVGKLPQESQNSTIITELFGNQALRVYQSRLPGMTYTLSYQPYRFTVHVGYENGQTVIIAKAPKGSTLRLIPREYFHDERGWDLPTPLVIGHVHWLDLSNGNVYIRPLASPWSLSKGTWNLNTRTRVCRKICPDNTHEDVVEPSSRLFDQIGNILGRICHKRQLLVSQRSFGKNLEVRIQSLRLLFYVNGSRRLYSPQLRLEVDPNQDAGTWYGLQSKLVCRKANDTSHRVILVPLGDISVTRSGPHVRVQIADDEKYGKFFINDTLGRIECAAEPLLIFTKALLHAYTSFPAPDPLTGRTGTEESLNWLQSGICYPWVAVESTVTPRPLAAISALTPIRVYYPPDLETMKTDHWNPNFTPHMQHPLFRPLIDGILAANSDLRSFSTAVQSKDDTPQTDHDLGDPRLNERALVRRQLYERKAVKTGPLDEVVDRQYLPRDRSLPSHERHARVLELVHLLRVSPEKFKTPNNLAAIFSQWNVVGGYDSTYDKISLSDRMHTDVREHWGSLVKYCLENRSHPYRLMFLFATLSFRGSADDALLKALVAFSIFDELQLLALPPWPKYFNFRAEQVPNFQGLFNSILPFAEPPPRDDGDELASFASSKQLRKMRASHDAYQARIAGHCKYLAEFILTQWPCSKPDVSSVDPDLLINVEAAMDAIQPEWLRLYQNMELSAHLDEVQKILNDRHSHYEYTVPGRPASAEIISGRTHCDGVPRLALDLIRKSFVSASSLEPFAGTQYPKNSSEHLDSPRESLGSGWIPLASGFQEESGLKSYRPDPKATENYSNQQVVSSKDTLAYTEELRQIVSELAESKSLVRKTYADNLLQSIEAFEKLRTPQQLAKPFLFLRSYATSRSETIRTFQSLKTSLEQPTPDMPRDRMEWLQLGGLWPNITTVTLLELLRSTESHEFGPGMREGLISFAVALTRFQRDKRLNDCVLAGDVSRFQDEEANIGHTNWDPDEQPDWLLLEIESNFLIRPGQVDVARATIWPASGANSVLQMNMGQGKTSCIIPMVAAAMANKKNLVRIIVPKALLQQTAQILQSRLGGILNRHVRHIPFSRRTTTTRENIELYMKIHKRMLKTAGVMLCLPEHNLSFMLSGQQRLLDDRVPEGAAMVRIQSWLKTVCRDILDESDFTLAVRTQLIYPSGSQSLVDGHPHRWQVIETVLSLVDRHLFGIESSFESSIKVVRRPGGGFPLVYFLRPDAEDEMLARLMVDITKGFGDILPIQSLRTRDRIAIKDFLTPNKTKLRNETLESIRDLCPDRPSVKQTVYLLRGLIVNRILIMTLKKRWNVQYGLHPGRSPVAVPYIAKGVASDQSEWGHPDVAILFTCLAFYYDGINLGQLKEALSRVLKSDDPSTEYDKWAQSCETFPEPLKAWNTINVDDDAQLLEIWQSVRYQILVIDFYLNNFVFPRHAKQFKIKLQSNGWDIPLFSASATDGECKQGLKPLTTGFSGTNDSRTMLPLTIRQEDLPTLSHTNAEVLTYLLHEKSRKCEVILDVRGERATERDFLFMLKRMNIRVLIDAGAQILEMDNETLVKTWLDIEKRCEAALYFDSENKPWVYSKGRKTPLLASPYADDLSKCLVYLDEAHTRGTDLKLPLNARGALTLGQGQSKDHTVQAAMRLRQLGTSQSITFFAPPEVHRVIADLRGKAMADQLDSYDVICWLLDNACNDIEMMQPLYFSQGTDFCRRTHAAIDNPQYLMDPGHRAKYVAAIKQNELQTLQEMYEPKGKIKASGFKSSHPKIAVFVKELDRRRKGFQDTGKAVHGSALQEVEQEREVEFEVECVRQVKKPVRYDAFTFPGLHRDLDMFVRTGRLPVDSYSTAHVFHVLSKTALGRKHAVSRSATNESQLYVSAEFERTARFHVGLGTRDNFLRPVNWVLWSYAIEAAVVLIPEEAEAVIRMMHRKQAHGDIRLMTYASPVTRRMMHFNSLTFFSMPSLRRDWEAPQWLKTELGILAGRLYFEWAEYESMCEFLNVNEHDSTAPRCIEDEVEEDDVVAFDGECEKTVLENPKLAKRSFAPRPLNFLQEWLAVRRHGQDFAHTPMGFLTQGKPLQANHPFFGSLSRGPNISTGAGPAAARIVARSGQEVDDDEHFGHDEGDVFDGIDDMGANVVDEDDEDDDDEYDEGGEEGSEDEAEESMSEYDSPDGGLTYSSDYDSGSDEGD
ncbi:hypothetical protein V8F06_002692 [Rhypophila decipiens]